MATTKRLRFHLSPCFFFLLLPLLLQFHSGMSELQFNYYAQSCPKAEEIIKQQVVQLYYKHGNTAVSWVRNLFHDCAVKSCDASLLLETVTGVASEQASERSFGMRNFKYVSTIKAALEAECPLKVSCADIVALSAREGIVMLGGPRIPIKTGRRDSRVSYLAEVEKFIPNHNDSIATALSVFNSIGIDDEGVVALYGAHSVGRVHCVNLVHRLYPTVDPTLDPVYAEYLKGRCPTPDPDPDAVVYARNDRETPMILDNNYYKNIINHKGLLIVDQQLASDPRTTPFVQKMAANNSYFHEQFSRAIALLSENNPLTGDQGEVPRIISGTPHNPRYPAQSEVPRAIQGTRHDSRNQKCRAKRGGQPPTTLPKVKDIVPRTVVLGHLPYNYCRAVLAPDLVSSRRSSWLHDIWLGTCGLVVCGVDMLLGTYSLMPPAGSPSQIFISKGDRSPPSASRSGNSYSKLPPMSASRVSPCFSSKQPTHSLRKRGGSCKPNVPAHSSYRPPKSPSATILKYDNLYSLGAMRATLGDLERIRTKYNIPPSVQLKVPHVDERPECPKSDGIALHIDLFDLELCLPLQPFYMKMFSYLGVAHGQLSLLGWRTLTGLQVLWSEGLVIVYFAAWGDHGNIVKGDPALKKGYKNGWFVTEGKWGIETLGDKGNHVEILNSFNVDCDLDPASKKKVLHLARYFYYFAENVTSKVAEEMEKMSLSERYGQALRATQEERITDLPGEKARVERDCDELRAINKDLLSRQKKMAEEAFSLIMTEVWSVDPELEVPRVEKFINKATILKMIEERKKSSHAQSGTPSGSPKVPGVLQLLLASNAPASTAYISGTLKSSADRLLETYGGDNIPPSV
ncbi:peroxidase 21 [Citrus sinensis]|nr:peroxidase 21 [Citrus sinensis]